MSKLWEPITVGRMQRGFVVPAFVGFGPRGLHRDGDIIFGRLPILSVLYLGHAWAPD